jgi:hypothetical protein
LEGPILFAFIFHGSADWPDTVKPNKNDNKILKKIFAFSCDLYKSVDG